LSLNYQNQIRTFQEKRAGEDDDDDVDDDDDDDEDEEEGYESPEDPFPHKARRRLMRRS
jgi:hypothetical protein